MEALDKAISLKPDRKYYLFRGTVHQEIGNYKGALVDYKYVHSNCDTADIEVVYPIYFCLEKLHGEAVQGCYRFWVDGTTQDCDFHAALKYTEEQLSFIESENGSLYARLKKVCKIRIKRYRKGLGL